MVQLPRSQRPIPCHFARLASVKATTLTQPASGTRPAPYGAWMLACNFPGSSTSMNGETPCPPAARSVQRSAYSSLGKIRTIETSRQSVASTRDPINCYRARASSCCSRAFHWGRMRLNETGFDIPAATSDAAGLPSLHTAKEQPRRCSSQAIRQPARPSPTINTRGDVGLISSPRAPRVHHPLYERLQWPDPVVHGCGLRTAAPVCVLRLSGLRGRRSQSHKCLLRAIDWP